MRTHFCFVPLAATIAIVIADASPLSAQVPRTGAATSNTCAAGIVSCDLNWSVQWFGIANPLLGGTLARAAIYTGIPAPPYAPNIAGTQQWISARNNGSVGTASRYFFQTTFASAVNSTVNFGLGWDNRLVGAFVGGSIDALTGLFTGGTSLLPGVSPATPFTSNGGTAGFCRNGDGVFPSNQWPNCVFNLALGVNANEANTLTFVVEGDGSTDGFLLGGADGVNTPVTTPAPPINMVPEPSSFALLALGAAGIAAVSRRRHRHRLLAAKAN